MTYKIIITKRAKYLFDRLVGHIYYNLKNPQATQNFRYAVDKIICRIEDNPYQFAKLLSDNLANKDYRGAIVSNMNYIIVYRIVDKTVYILGIFHTKEKFDNKIE